MNFHRFGISIKRILQQPKKIAMICGVFLVISLLGNGLLWRLWELHHEMDRISAEVLEINTASSRLQAQLRQAKDPSFIEQQAKDKLDLVAENELVFVFADGP